MLNGFPRIDSGDIADAGHADVKVMDYNKGLGLLEIPEFSELHGQNLMGH